MHRSDTGPFENLFGQVVLSHARGRGIDRRLQHHEIDETGDTRFARGDGHGRGGVEQPVLHRVSKINRRNVLHRALDRADVEEVAFEYFGAERAQLVGTFVDLVDEGANRNSALKQHFGYMPSGLALPAAGRGSDENWFCHGYGSFTFCPGLVPCGTNGFEHMVPHGTKSRET